MVPVRGLDKPPLQWALLACCLMLTALLVATTGRLRRVAADLRVADASLRTAGRQVQSVEGELARERASREALGLELIRLRSGQQSGAAAAPAIPTLTIEPAGKRTGEPPDATVAAPPRGQVVEVRLILPEGVAPPESIEIAARDWSSGRARWSVAAPRPSTVDGRRAVSAYVTGDMLLPGQYEIALTSSAGQGAAPEILGTYEVAIK